MSWSAKAICIAGLVLCLSTGAESQVSSQYKARIDPVSIKTSGSSYTFEVQIINPEPLQEVTLNFTYGPEADLEISAAKMLISTSWFTSVKKGTVTLVNSNADNPDYIPVSPGLTALVRIIVKNYSPLYSAVCLLDGSMITAGDETVFPEIDTLSECPEPIKHSKGSTDPTQQECEGSIWDVIQNTPELSNFMQLVSSADIAMLFKGTLSNITVFVPVNDGFSNFAKKTGLELDTEVLNGATGVFKHTAAYHIVKGRWDIEQLKSYAFATGQVGGAYVLHAETNEGTLLKVHHNGGLDVYINNAKIVTQPFNEGCNGTIYHVDQPLEFLSVPAPAGIIYPMSTMDYMASEYGKTSTFWAMVEKADYKDTINDYAGTVFAPTNDAFSKMYESDDIEIKSFDDLMSLPSDTLQQLIDRHISKDTIVAAKMFNASSFSLKSGEDITIVLEYSHGKEVATGYVCEENCKLKSEIESIDMVTTTGVVQLVDRVLLGDYILKTPPPPLPIDPSETATIRFSPTSKCVTDKNLSISVEYNSTASLGEIRFRIKNDGDEVDFFDAKFGGGIIEKSWDVTLIQDSLEIVAFASHLVDGNDNKLPKTDSFKSLIDINLGSHTINSGQCFCIQPIGIWAAPQFGENPINVVIDPSSLCGGSDKYDLVLENTTPTPSGNGHVQVPVDIVNSKAVTQISFSLTYTDGTPLNVQSVTGNGQWKSDGYNFNAGQSAGTVDVVPSDPTILPIAPHYGEKPLLNVEIAGYQPSKSAICVEKAFLTLDNHLIVQPDTSNNPAACPTSSPASPGQPPASPPSPSSPTCTGTLLDAIKNMKKVKLDIFLSLLEMGDGHIAGLLNSTTDESRLTVFAPIDYAYNEFFNTVGISLSDAKENSTEKYLMDLALNQVVSGQYSAEGLKNLYDKSPKYKIFNGYVLPTFEGHNKLKLDYIQDGKTELVEVDGTTLDEKFVNGIETCNGVLYVTSKPILVPQSYGLESPNLSGEPSLFLSQQHNDFSIFWAIVQKANLVPFLDSSAEKTMFIPRNLAFEKFFKGNVLSIDSVEKLLALPNEVLDDIVKQHTFGGYVMSGYMYNSSTFTSERNVHYTVHLNYFKAYAAPDAILFKDNKEMSVISATDKWAGSTIMHTLDKVLEFNKSTLPSDFAPSKPSNTPSVDNVAFRLKSGFKCLNSTSNTISFEYKSAKPLTQFEFIIQSNKPGKEFFFVELVNGVMDIEWEATYVPQNSFVLASNEKNTSSLESTTDFRPLISLRFSKLTEFGECFCIKAGSAIATVQGSKDPIAVFIPDEDLCQTGGSPTSPVSASPPPPPSPSPPPPPLSSPPPAQVQKKNTGSGKKSSGPGAAMVVGIVLSVVAVLGLSAAATIMWKRRRVSRNYNGGGMGDNYDGYGIPLMQNDFHSL